MMIVKNQRDKIKLFAKAIGIVGVIALGLYFGKYLESNSLVLSLVRSYGYTAIFFVGFISGFNLVVPIPAASFFPLFLGAGLNFWGIIVIAAIGMTVADLLGYLIGKIGRSYMDLSDKQQDRFQKFERLKKKHPWAPPIILFFYASLIPFPNEVLTVLFGLLRYRARNLFLPLLLGNIAFNTLTAYGVLNLFEAIK